MQRLLLAFSPVALAAVLGSLVTMPAIPVWYAGLAKPGFTPPNAAFGPAWTLLYILMGYAAYRILSLPAAMPGRGLALKIFFAQLALNSAWSFAFFGARSPLAGLVVIVALLLAILMTMHAFWALDRIAALLLVPYLAWVTFASALNFAIWWLN